MDLTFLAECGANAIEADWGLQPHHVFLVSYE